MAGRKRVLGLSRALAPGAVACVVLGAGACDTGNNSPPYYQEGFGPGQGSGGSVGVGGATLGLGAFTATAGSPTGTTGGPVLGSSGCIPPPVVAPVFASQVFNSGLGARRELYSWTTPEQVAALRTDQVLFTLEETKGLGEGYAFTFLKTFAANSTNPEQTQLATILGGSLFAKKRYAWPEPWATRMGWPGEDYGNNLLRVVLRPEAWLVVVGNGLLTVYDLDNTVVSMSDALAHPERIGAILYVKDAASGGPTCNSSFVAGSNGYREFILGNLAMVEEWSVGTQAIRDRLASNIDQLTRFLAGMRGCPSVATSAQWNLQVVCSWNASLNPATSEIFAYEQALAIPSQNYLPVPNQIAAIIETLQGDLFEPDPLVVKLGSP